MAKVVSVTRNDFDGQHRRELRVWMRQVLATRSWSPEHWAKAAGLAGSTLRRFLNGGEDAPTPSLDTIQKLVDVAGFGPNIRFNDLAQARSAAKPIRILSPDLVLQMVSRKVVGDLRDHIEQCPSLISEEAGSPDAYAVRIEHNSCDQLGLYRNDIVVVEPVWRREPEAADLVIVDDFTQIMPLTYHPPLLFPRSTDPTYDPRPVDEVHVLGVICEIRRRL